MARCAFVVAKEVFYHSNYDECVAPGSLNDEQAILYLEV